MDIDLIKLRTEAARRDLRMWQIAAGIGISPSRLSQFAHGRGRTPASLRLRLERYLRLPDGFLAPTDVG